MSPVASGAAAAPRPFARGAFGGAMARPAPAPWAAASDRRVRPVTLVVFALFASALGQLGRVPLFLSQGKDVPVLVQELPLAAALVLGALACVRARSLRLDGVALAALAFALVGALSAGIGADTFHLSGGELAVSLAYLARWVAYFGVYLLIVNGARDSDAEGLWRAVERSVLAFAAFGLVQAVFLPGFAQKVKAVGEGAMPWDWQGHRLVSTILDPNYAGGLIMLPLLVLLARLASGDRVPLWKPLMLLAALVATFSRSSVLGLVVGGLVIVAARGLRRPLLRFAGFAALAALPAIPLIVRFGAEYRKFTVRDGSALQRAVMWLRALRVFLDHPVLGVGFNTYGFVQRSYGWEILGRDGFAVDGGLLFVAVMTGAVGLALYLLMFGLMWRRARRLWRDRAAPAAARGTALGVAAASLALVVHSCFVNSLMLPFILGPLWALWGVVYLDARAWAGRRGARAGAAP